MIFLGEHQHHQRLIAKRLAPMRRLSSTPRYEPFGVFNFALQGIERSHVLVRHGDEPLILMQQLLSMVFAPLGAPSLVVASIPSLSSLVGLHLSSLVGLLFALLGAANLFGLLGAASLGALFSAFFCPSCAPFGVAQF
jgi:hypothetical protein